MTPEATLTISPESAGPIADELVRKLTQITAHYGHAAIGLFVGSPSSLAYLAGRAINITVVASTALYQHTPHEEEPVYSLPFDPRSDPAVPYDAALAGA